MRNGVSILIFTYISSILIRWHYSTRYCTQMRVHSSLSNECAHLRIPKGDYDISFCTLLNLKLHHALELWSQLDLQSTSLASPGRLLQSEPFLKCRQEKNELKEITTLDRARSIFQPRSNRSSPGDRKPNFVKLSQVRRRFCCMMNRICEAMCPCEQAL